MTAGERLIQQGLERGLERGRELGLEQGLERGREEARREREEMLLKLIQLKFNATDPQTIARVHDASSETAKRWIAAILTAETLEELFNT